MSSISLTLGPPSSTSIRADAAVAAESPRIGVLAEQAARCNTHLAPVFVQELCLAVESGSDCDLQSLLALLEPFLRAIVALPASGGPTGYATLQTVARELVGMTHTVVTADRRALRVVMRFWAVFSGLDALLIGLALEALLSRAVTGDADEVALTGEVRPRLIEAM